MTTMIRNLSNNVVLQKCGFCLLKRLFSKEVPTKYKETILSAIQPTGNVHLGNYLGSVQNWVKLQNEYENTFWFIADMHAITIPHDPKMLQENILKSTAMLVACGIDPKRSVLFQQSKVGLHGELCWILSTLLTTNRLTHLHHFKEKSKTATDMLHGLLSYPILQAADIMLYKATKIPVGEDQVQHVHLVEHIVQKFNTVYGKTFPTPGVIVDVGGKRIKALNEPSKKMSKSSKSTIGRIELTDEPDMILKKIKKAVTDFISEVYFDEVERPGVSNLINIHSLITGKSVEEIRKEAEGLDTGKYKLLLADVVIEKIKPIQNQYFELMKDPDYLLNILEIGADKARAEAEICMQEVYEKIGFLAVKKKSLHAKARQ